MVTLELTPKTSDVDAALEANAKTYELRRHGAAWLVDRETDDENAATVWGNLLAKRMGFSADMLNVRPM